MTRRRYRTLTLAVTLLLVLVGASSVGVASAEETHVVYFPWVPNNETFGSEGPWSATLAFHNLSNTPCAMSVYVVHDGVWTRTAQLSLNAASSLSVGAQSLGVPKPGSPVRFQAVCPIAASLKAFAPATNTAPWSDGAEIVTGYTGLAESDIAASRSGSDAGWVLPIVQTNTGWNTYITTANLGSAVTDVTVQLYPADNQNGASGATLTLQRRLSSGTIWTIDALQELGETGWVGFARITANGDIGVIARRIKPTARMAMTNVGIATSDLSVSSYRSAAPLLFNAYNGWNTGITLANPSASPAIVTVEYYEAGGGYVSNTQLVVPPSSMQYIYTPGSVGNEGFVGSANILSNVPIVSSVDEVKYETIEGMSYVTGVGQRTAAIPLVFRENPAKRQHDNSGISISNLDPDASAAVSVQLLSLYGVDLLPQPIEVIIPAGGVAVVYLPAVEGLAPGTVATARLTTASPAGFVAISNDVNYVAAGDGSVVFSAGSIEGIYVTGGTTP